MSDAELRVNLKISQESVKEEAEKAAQIANKTLAQAVSKGGGGSSSFYKLNPQLFEKSGEQVGNSFSKGFSKSLDRANKKFMRDTESLVKNAMFLSAPFVGFGTSFMARQTFTALRTDRAMAMQQNLLGSSRISTSLGVTAVITAVVKGLQAFTNAIKDATTEAVKYSHSIYSKAISSGFGIGATTLRGMLSEVLGVSEKDIYRFGAALEYIRPKIKTASEEISKNVPTLTALSIELRVFKLNMLAIGSQIMSSISPALQGFMENLNAFLEVLNKSGAIKALAGAIGVILAGLKDIIGLIQIAVSSFLLGLNLIYDGVKWIFAKISKIPGLGSLSKDDPDAVWEDMKKSSEDVNKQIGTWRNNIGYKEGGRVPAPVGNFGQLGASQWEKMGLIVGGSSGTNYAKQTADNTKKMATYLERMLGVDGAKDYPYALPSLA